MLNPTKLKKGDIIVVFGLNNSYWVVKCERKYGEDSIISLESLFVHNIPNSGIGGGDFSLERDLFRIHKIGKPTKFEKFWFLECSKQKKFINRSEVEKLFRINKIEKIINL